MPRISRHVVSFTVRGKEWLATFGHQHSKEMYSEQKRRIIEVGLTDVLNPMPARHITTCRLSMAARPHQSVMADARCSMKEPYNWKKGIKVSFERALVKAGYKAPIAGETAAPIVVMGKTVGTYQQFVKDIRPSTDPDRIAWGQMLKAFYTEMGFRGTPTSGGGAASHLPTIEATIVAASERPSLQLRRRDNVLPMILNRPPHVEEAYKWGLGFTEGGYARHQEPHGMGAVR